MQFSTSSDTNKNQRRAARKLATFHDSQDVLNNLVWYEPENGSKQEKRKKYLKNLTEYWQKYALSKVFKAKYGNWDIVLKIR